MFIQKSVEKCRTESPKSTSVHKTENSRGVIWASCLSVLSWDRLNPFRIKALQFNNEIRSRIDIRDSPCVTWKRQSLQRGVSTCYTLSVLLCTCVTLEASNAR